MKITILDMETAAINNDISLDSMCELGELNIIGTTDNSRTAEFIGDSDVVICNKSRITREVMERCPNLKYVGTMGTGFDQIDIQAANERGITVCNVPAYSADAVAQHTFALILNYYCKISEYAADVSNGGWTQKKYFTSFGLPTYELSGKTIGLIGCGDIGRKVARIADACGMHVLAYNRNPDKLRDIDYIKCVSLEELLTQSDIVSIHAPLNDSTCELINRDTLAIMKHSSLLVNTARGGIVNEADLADALNIGTIAAAAVDALTVEPMSDETPLRGAKNLTITPHIAWAPIETRRRLMKTVYENLKCFILGAPQNVVNTKN
ncbi:MAG: D-2-hydroxyacid dehydrogenase [Acutalibacteraceae bacterium]